MNVKSKKLQGTMNVEKDRIKFEKRFWDLILLRVTLYYKFIFWFQQLSFQALQTSNGGKIVFSWINFNPIRLLVGNLKLPSIPCKDEFITRYA